MKKIRFAVLALLVCVGLWGCGKQEEPAAETAAVLAQSQPATESTEATEPAAPTEHVETYNDENGNTVVVYIGPDGSRTETYNHPDGSMTSIYDNPETGEHIEAEFSKDFVRRRESSYNPKTDRYSNVEYYENGNMKYSGVREPSKGFISEQEYYENGNRKYIKTRDPEMGREMQYNEEGYCTYSCSESYREDGSVYYKLECFGDKTGKLTKVIENGEVIENAKFLSDRINEFNFRKEE